MKTEILQAGKIVNTHGLRGEVKITPWADSPEFITERESLLVDGQKLKILSARAHKGNAIVLFEGVGDINAAIRLKNKVVSVSKEDVPLPEGRYYVAELCGLTAVDDATGEKLGTVADVLTLPAGDVYVIRGEREILVPAVPEFVKLVDIDGGVIRFSLIEGM